MSDVAEAYRERDFPGKKFLAVGLSAWGLYWISSWVIRWNKLPDYIIYITWGLLAVASVFYLIGYWQAVKGKGYPKLLWLASLTGIIGAIIIFFLPDISYTRSIKSTPET